MELKPTTRFVIEPTLNCNLKPPCKFCYHLHKYENWDKTTKPIEKVFEEIDQGIARGNDYMDITGGEPTIYSGIEDVVSYALERGVKTCIITNGIVNENKINSLLEAGLDEFLVSRHGIEETHNFICNYSKAYEKQVNFLEMIKDKISLRFNCVINNFNTNQLWPVAMEVAKYNPKIVNYINMNPHNEWMHKTLETRDVIANLRHVKPDLQAAIHYLHLRNIAVNVRYYPLCLLDEQYRPCVCNDLHVTFDPYEWDYNIQTKTIEAHFEWGKACSDDIEEKGEPCNICRLRRCCGGINKAFHKAAQEAYGEICQPETGLKCDIQDYYHYRRHQDLAPGTENISGTATFGGLS